MGKPKISKQMLYETLLGRWRLISLKWDPQLSQKDFPKGPHWFRNGSLDMELRGSRDSAALHTYVITKDFVSPMFSDQIGSGEKPKTDKVVGEVL